MTGQSDPPASTATSPAPISVDADLFDLKASPAALERAAGSWRQLKDSAGSADELVSDAAGQVVGEGWSGQAAESYDGHRRTLTAGLADLADDAAAVAEALDEVAHVLRTNQEALTEQADTLAEVPATRGAELTFQPTDQAQAELVHDAVAAAREIRSHVDSQLALKQPILDGAVSRLARLGEDWQPRTFTMVNLNVGQGHRNEPWQAEGTDPADIGDLARTLVDGDADIATLQEIFGEEAENLEHELEARTGDEWTVHFGAASNKPYWGDGPVPAGVWEPFGNAVAVRHGDGVDSSTTVDTHDLNAPGNRIDTPDGPVTDGEERSALEVDIHLAGG